jgi:hypothetical protein
MEDIMIIFICLMAVIAIESLMLIFIVWKTPALTFLMASFFKQPVMYLIGKDRLGVFKRFKPENGAGKIRGVGLFNLTENSSTLEIGSKTPIYLGFRDLAATLFPEYPAIVQELREQGIIINNVEDVNKYIARIKMGMTMDLPIKVRPFKTYKFHDLENMFPNNIDPTFIDATVQCEISKAIKLMKVGPKLAGGAIILFMAAAIAIFIIQKAFTGQIAAKDCQAMVSAAKCAATIMVNTTHIMGPAIL